MCNQTNQIIFGTITADSHLYGLSNRFQAIFCSGECQYMGDFTPYGKTVHGVKIASHVAGIVRVSPKHRLYLVETNPL